MFDLQNQDFFLGALRFSPILMIINITFAIYFIFSWRRTYKKTGWKIDFWHFSMLMMFIIPVVIMYPFSAALPNLAVMGHHYETVEPFVNEAYLITILGFFFIFIGRYMFDAIKLNSPFSIILFVSFSSFFSKIIRQNIYKKFGLIFFSFILIMSLIFLVIFQLKTGYLGDVRAFFFSFPVFRPIYNFITIFYPTIFIFLFLRYITFKERFILIIMISLVVLSLFLGTRGATFGTLLGAAMLYIYSIKGQINIFKFFLFGILLLILVISMGSFRQGVYDISQIFLSMSMNIFYGNNFSDVRDFAWILAYWDYEYIYGKSYLAGLISFVPSSLSEFRETWSISRYTNSFVGFDSSIHPGLRPGIFGESFINFGLVGVSSLGLITGYFLRYVDVAIKKSINLHDDIIMAYSKTFIFVFISNFFITAGFFALYVFLFLLLSIFFINSIVYSIAGKKRFQC